MKKLLLFAGALALLVVACDSEGFRISSRFNSADQATIVDAIGRWQEASGLQQNVRIVDSGANILTFDEVPARLRDERAGHQGFTLDGKRAYLRENVNLVVAMHEIGHLYGVPHIPDDPLMRGGAGMTPVITSAALERISRVP